MAVFLTDEHVPRVFVTALRSSGHEVLRANDEFGEGTEDQALLQFCAEAGRLLITNDKKDFAGKLAASIHHSGIIVYTDPNLPRDDPETTVRAIERVLSHYSVEDLANEIVWLDQWIE